MTQILCKRHLYLISLSFCSKRLLVFLVFLFVCLFSLSYYVYVFLSPLPQLKKKKKEKDLPFGFVHSRFSQLSLDLGETTAVQGGYFAVVLTGLRGILFWMPCLQ